MNKKGFQSEGMSFNVKSVSIIIFFIVVLAVVMVLLLPRLTSTTFSEAASNFGRYIWDVLAGG